MDQLSLITAGLLVLVVVIAYMLVAFRSLRTMQSVDDFFIFNRRLRDTSVFATTFSAEMSLATVFIAFMTLATFLGLNLFIAMGTFIAGQALLWLAIPRIKERVFWGETLQTFLGNSYSSAYLRRFASIASVVGFVGLFSTEIIVGSSLFTSLTGVESSGIAITALIATLVVFYTTLGGFKSVVATDRWQTLGILFVVFMLVYAALTLGGDEKRPLIESRFVDEFQFAPLLAFNFLIINTLYPICDMSAWQRIAAAKDSKTARRGFFVALVSFAITWSLLIFAALALTEYTAGHTGGGALIAPLSAVANSGLLGTILIGITLAALAAAMLSTGDTFLIAAAQSLSIDVLTSRFFAARRAYEQAELADSIVSPASEKASNSRGDSVFHNEVYEGTTSHSVLFRARVAIVCMAVVGIIVMSLLQGIGFAVADFVFVIYGSTVAFLPVIVGAFLLDKILLPRLARTSIVSLIAGLSGGWTYGVLSVTDLAPTLPVLGEATAYNSPTVALALSTTIYAAGTILKKFR